MTLNRNEFANYYFYQSESQEIILETETNEGSSGSGNSAYNSFVTDDFERVQFSDLENSMSQTASREE
mgnify:CR=1 FL=1